MLWWDDNQKKVFKNEDSIPCFRSSGIVKIPKKIPRKISLPVLVNENNFIQQRKLSCPSLKRACELEIINQTELAEDLRIIAKERPETLIQPKTEAVKKPKLVGVKVVTREPEVEAEMKRATMREKWGLNLLYRITEGRLELCVKKVGMFGAAKKCGLAEGNILVQINGWKIEAMDNYQAAVNVFLAAGYAVSVGWIKSEPLSEEDSDWSPLDPL